MLGNEAVGRRPLKNVWIIPVLCVVAGLLTAYGQHGVYEARADKSAKLAGQAKLSPGAAFANTEFLKCRKDSFTRTEQDCVGVVIQLAAGHGPEFVKSVGEAFKVAGMLSGDN